MMYMQNMGYKYKLYKGTGDGRGTRMLREVHGTMRG